MTPEQVRALLDGLVERASEHAALRELVRQQAEGPHAMDGSLNEVEQERARGAAKLERAEWENRVRTAYASLQAWRTATEIALGAGAIREIPF